MQSWANSNESAQMTDSHPACACLPHLPACLIAFQGAPLLLLCVLPCSFPTCSKHATNQNAMSQHCGSPVAHSWFAKRHECAAAHASDSINSVRADASCPSFASAVVSARLTRRCEGGSAGRDAIRGDRPEQTTNTCGAVACMAGRHMAHGRAAP